MREKRAESELVLVRRATMRLDLLCEGVLGVLRGREAAPGVRLGAVVRGDFYRDSSPFGPFLALYPGFSLLLHSSPTPLPHFSLLPHSALNPSDFARA